MKRSFLIIVCLCALGVFAGCDKNSGGETTGGAIKKIEALVENGSSYSDLIDEVKVFILDEDDNNIEEVEIATGEYVDGGFVIELPATVDNDLLNMEYLDDDNMGGFKIGGNAMMGFTVLSACKSGEKVGYFWYEYESDTRESGRGLVYVDSDLSITGSYSGEDSDGEKYTATASCTLKKGWNFIYYSDEETGGGEYKMSLSTKAPSGLKWHFQRY